MANNQYNRGIIFVVQSLSNTRTLDVSPSTHPMSTFARRCKSCPVLILHIAIWGDISHTKPMSINFCGLFHYLICYHQMCTPRRHTKPPSCPFFVNTYSFIPYNTPLSKMEKETFSQFISASAPYGRTQTGEECPKFTP